MRQRIEFIDLAKGICILLVVLLHVYGDTSGEVIKIMNLFRMPLYFVLSGMFFKTYNGLWAFVKKKTNKLLIPFFCSLFFVVVPTTFLLNKTGGNDMAFCNLLFADYGRFNLGINGASWFLICLFVVNIIFYIIFLLSQHNIVAIVVGGGICGVIGYTLNVYEQHLPMWIDSALTATPFFIIGYVMKQYCNMLYDNLSRKYYLFLLISFVVLLGIYSINEYQEKNMVAFGENRYDMNILFLYVAGFAGTYCVLIISKYFSYMPIISYIGRYSIVVLLTHLLYLFAMRNILYQLGVDQESGIVNLCVFAVIVILSLPTIKFCVKYLPYCFAQKDLLK